MKLCVVGSSEEKHKEFYVTREFQRDLKVNSIGIDSKCIGDKNVLVDEWIDERR